MSYLSWYLLSFVSVFGGLYVGLRPYILPGRFFLGVLPLLLLWAVEVMKAIEHSLSRRLVVGIFLLLFVLTPLYFNRSHLISHESSLIDRLEHFAHQVRQATKPVPQNCFEFQGVRNRVNLVRYLYLPGSQQEYFCPQRYRVVLGVGSREFPQFKDLTSYEEIFSDGEGNKLLRKINF